jgi:16S rRNA (cytosine1402-N4)-methyltransferase
MKQVFHVPVLLEETVQCLQCGCDGVYVDCTVGTGGHSERILKETAPKGMVVGIDVDAESLAIAKRRLETFGSRFIGIHDDYRNLPEILDSLRMEEVDGILVDLGLSSFQLSDPSRGFSFQKEGLLDMRFNRKAGAPVHAVINELSERQIQQLLKRFGEEKHSKSIAREIVKTCKKKRVEKTSDLVAIVKKAHGKKPWRINPATKVFQSLRIFINEELEGLDEFLQRAAKHLKKGKRLVVLAYHSLEDRIVKQTFKKLSFPCSCPPSLPVCGCGKEKVVSILTSRPITPKKEELLQNPRSRSAKMRAVEKI